MKTCYFCQKPIREIEPHCQVWWIGTGLATPEEGYFLHIACIHQAAGLFWAHMEHGKREGQEAH